jgi:hypothetical protein
MVRSRLVIPLALTVAIGVAGCGGGGSAGTAAGSSSTRTSTAPSSLASATTAPGDAAFCNAFNEVKTELPGTTTGKDAATKLRDLANKVEATAPQELKDDVKHLATFYRTLADTAEKGTTPSSAPSFGTDYADAIGKVGVWVATHCKD